VKTIFMFLMTLLLISGGAARAQVSAAQVAQRPGESNAAWAQRIAAAQGADPERSTVDKIVTNSCSSGIKEACDLRAEAAGIKHVIHMQEFLSDVCRMGTTEYPLTDDDEQTACTVRDTLTQTIKDRGYRWDNDEKEWVTGTPASAGSIAIPRSQNDSHVVAGGTATVNTLANGERWILINPDKNGDRILGIQLQPGMPAKGQFATKVVMNNPDQDGPGSAQISIVGDCQAKTYEIMSIQAYEGQYRSGAPVGSPSAPEGLLNTPDPESPMAFVLTTVCADHSSVVATK
jgi:hypothetical protein